MNYSNEYRNARIVSTLNLMIMPPGECIRAESNRGVPVYTNSLAVAQDTETFHAFLKVHEDFGCVMFEPEDS